MQLKNEHGFSAECKSQSPLRLPAQLGQVSEAAAMLAAGSRDVLITNMLSEHGTSCLARLAARYPSAAVSTLVDCPAHVANLQASEGEAIAFCCVTCCSTNPH